MGETAFAATRPKDCHISIPEQSCAAGEVEFQPIGFWTGTADGRIQSSLIFGVSNQMGPDAWAGE
jgi:hypothetical protein